MQQGTQTQSTAIEATGLSNAHRATAVTFARSAGRSPSPIHCTIDQYRGNRGAHLAALAQRSPTSPPFLGSATMFGNGGQSQLGTSPNWLVAMQLLVQCAVAELGGVQGRASSLFGDLFLSLQAGLR